MAETIKGINVVIGSDTTALSKALSDVNKTSGSLQRELRQVEQLLKFDPGNTELLAQKQQLLQQSIINTARKLEQLRQAQAQVNDQFERGEISEGQYRAFQREIAKTEQELKRMDGQLDQNTNSLKAQGVTVSKLGKEYEEAFDQAKRAMGNAFDQAKALGTGLTAAGAGLAAGLGKAISTSSEFEAQLSRVGAIAEATDSQLLELRDSALELGASTSKSASEVAKGQEELAALGFTVEEILGAMPGVISAAEASGADMAQTAEVMASTLNIFGKEASEATKVADILAKTANVSAANITDMQYALKYAGPPAAALGISLEELSAAIGIMTNAGMQGEQAGTSLRSALLALLNPSEENSKLMSAMGVEITDLEGNFIGLEKLVQNLSDSMVGMSDTQKAATLASLVGTEAVSGILSLMAAGPEEINKFSQALEDSGGASAKAAAQMKDNLKGSVEEMSGAFETLMITIGTALTPMIQALANALGGLANWFNGLSPTLQSFIAIAGAVAAAVGLIAGPLLLIVGFIPQIAAGLSALGPAFAALTGPIGIVVAAIAGLVAGITVLYNTNDEARAKIDAAWKAIQTAAQTIFNAVSGIIKTVFGAIKQFWTTWGGDIKSFFQTLWDAVSKIFKAVFDTISKIVKTVFNDIKAFWDQWGGTIQQTFKNLWEIVKTIFSAAFTVISTVVMTAFNAIKAFWDTWGSTIQTVFTTIWNVVKTIFQGAWEGIKIIVETAVKVISGIVDVWLKVFQGDWKGAWESAKKVASDLWNGILKIFANAFEVMMDVGKNIINGLIQGIKNLAGAVVDTAKDIAKSIADAFTDFFDIHSPSRLTKGFGKNIVQGLAEGIAETSREAVKAATSLSASVSKAMSLDPTNVSVAANASLERAKSINGANGGRSITQQITINSPQPLSPSETARLNLRAARQLGMEW
ncbi:phage tail tape measure protein [Neobacillus mesonae]|nr:phage tail tape measure protein [Neobacillus mesonae]